jgi:hypothetical protein
MGAGQKNARRSSAGETRETTKRGAGRPGARPEKVDGESAVLAAIAAMPEPYQSMGKRLHEIIRTNAPTLSPRTWYGMPAYSGGDGTVVCFFRGGDKFKERYMTLGFNDEAKLDEGHLWPVAFAVTEVTAVEEAKVAALVKKAVGGG